MSRETTAVSAAGVTSAMLRPEGHGQNKRDRPIGQQATHKLIISPFNKKSPGVVGNAPTPPSKLAMMDIDE
jgi:hypothetical protein